MNISERFDKLDQMVRDNKVLRCSWKQADRACLLAALSPECAEQRSSTACPSSLLPKWFAQLTPSMDDNGTQEAWREFVVRYAAVVRRAATNLDVVSWRKAEYLVRAATLDEAMQHTKSAAILGVCAESRALCLRVTVGDEPSEVEWSAARSAAASAARNAADAARAARSAAYAAESAAGAATYAAWAAEAEESAANVAAASAARNAADAARAARSAAGAATYAAEAEESAAGAATYAAWAAESAARNAAESAAWAARNAARSAAGAARNAARSAAGAAWGTAESAADVACSTAWNRLNAKILDILEELSK